jgi:hypothetical protein
MDKVTELQNKIVCNMIESSITDETRRNIFKCFVGKGTTGMSYGSIRLTELVNQYTKIKNCEIRMIQ